MQRKITLLDLGGVVFQSTGKSNKKINWEIINSLNDKYGHALNIGEAKFPDFLKEYNDITHQNLSGNQFLEMVFDTLEFNEVLIEMLRAKSDIVIVSDNYRENIRYISQRYDFQSWAVNQIYSFEYKLEKSNAEFFKRLIQDLTNCDKEKMLLIDDSPAKIESAAKNGIKGILFISNEQITEELKKHDR